MNQNISFPIPVLGNSNDIVREVPNYELATTINGTSVEFRVEPFPLTTGNLAIDSCVTAENAGWFLRVHCSRTYYRKEFRLDLNNPIIRIGVDEIEGIVELELFVISLKEIKEYRPEDLHADYGTTTFNVNAGEVMAIVGAYEVNVEPRYNPMVANPKSLISFQKDEDRPSGSFVTDFSGDKITVFLPADEWKHVNDMNHRIPELSHAAIIFPVLVNAIHLIQNQKDEYRTNKWASRLAALMESKKIPASDPLKGAQELLENPLGRFLFKVNRELIGV